jgi:hypothetical protein
LSGRGVYLVYAQSGSLGERDAAALRGVAHDVRVGARGEAAKDWYMQYSFEESPTDPLHVMMLMKDMRAFLKRHGIG